MRCIDCGNPTSAEPRPGCHEVHWRIFLGVRERVCGPCGHGVDRHAALLGLCGDCPCRNTFVSETWSLEQYADWFIAQRRGLTSRADAEAWARGALAREAAEAERRRRI